MAVEDSGAVPRGLVSGTGVIPTKDPATGKLRTEDMPPPALGTPYTAASQAAMLALSAAVANDTCYRSDTTTYYRLSATPASTLANWIPIGGNGVLTWNGRNGAVTPVAGDITPLLGNSATKDTGTTSSTVALGNAPAAAQTAAIATSEAYTDTQVALYRGNAPADKFLPVTVFTSVGGSFSNPTIGQYNNWQIATFLHGVNSALCTEVYTKELRGWTAFDISVELSAPSSLTSGSAAVFRFYAINTYGELIDTATISAGTPTNDDAVITVPADNARHRFLIASAQTFASNDELVRIFIARMGADGRDTCGNDLRVLGVTLKANPYWG